jgi:hypothetical protein
MSSKAFTFRSQSEAREGRPTAASEASYNVSITYCFRCIKEVVQNIQGWKQFALTQFCIPRCRYFCCPCSLQMESYC